MKLLALLVLLLGSSACAQRASAPVAPAGGTAAANADLDLPGRGVTQEVASQWSCRFDALEDAAALHINALSPGRTFTPEVGWDVCELLGKMGAPRDFETDRANGVRTAMLRYGTPADPTMVALTFNVAENKWMVTGVN